MRAGLLAAGLALSSGALPVQDPAPAEQEPGAPPQAPIAGLAGFRSRSRVLAGDDAAPPRILDAYYVFPDRVRWDSLPEGSPESQRTLHYRFGERYWVRPAGVASSRPLEHGELVATKVHMELRRALMLWPDGFDWRGEGNGRMSATRLRVRIPQAEEAVAVVFHARLGEAGRPTELRADVGLLDLMALGDITWREERGRWWPHTLAVEQRVPLGEEQWRETIESVDTRIQLLDHFFLPPDRKPALPRGFGAPVEVRVPPAVALRLPLAEAGSWEDVLARCGRLRLDMAARLREQGLRLEQGLVLELAPDGTPLACVLRLAEASEPTPEGWSLLPEREAWTLRLQGRGPVSPAVLLQLREALPAGCAPGTAYVRLSAASDGATRIQVLQPFERAR